MTNELHTPLHWRLSRRMALKWMASVAGATALAACSSASSPGANGADAPDGERPSLVVAHRREYFKEVESIFAQTVVDWGVEHDVDVETTTVAAEAVEDFALDLLAQVEAGDPPSLVYHVRLVQRLYAQGALEPVSDAVEHAVEMYGEPPYGQRKINLIDGEWWGIPYMMSGGGQFARRSVFEEAGYDPLEDLITYDQRRNAALAVSNSDKNFYGWGVTVNRGGDATGFIQDIIQNWGGHYTNAEITEVAFNSPETVSAVEWLAEIYTGKQYAPMLPPGLMGWTDSSNNEAYLVETIAYTHNAASVYAKAKADDNPVFEDTVVLETGIGPLGEKLETGGGGQFNIPRGATHQDLSKELALYMLTPEIFLPISLVSAGLFLPAYASYYEMEEVLHAFRTDENLARMARSAQGSHPGASWPAQPSPLFDAIAAQTVLTDMMAEIVAHDVAPAKAVAQAAERIAIIGQQMKIFSKS